MKLTLYCTPHFCGQWPVIKVILNNKEINTFQVTEENPNITVNLKLEEQNNLKINYFNKKEKHTAYKDGAILQDQYLSLDCIRIDDILVETWLLTEGYYEPDYFPGYLKSTHNQKLDTKLKSQLIWHFPGTFSFPTFTKNFWDWYYVNKIQKEVVKFTDKDPERIFKYRGSLDPCTEIVKKLKELIK